jgi:hypothetical protein
MGLGDRLGFVGILLALIGIAITLLWPTKRWIGWVCLVLAGILGLSWAGLEFRDRRLKKLNANTDNTLPDFTFTASSSPFYDFKISKQALMASIKVDTKYALVYKNNLNFIIILRAVDDSVDAMNDARLMKSEPFEITGEVRTIQVNLTKESFDRSEAASKTLSQGNLAVYVALIPKNVRPEQIVTIRDIRRLGGKQVQVNQGLQEKANPY